MDYTKLIETMTSGNTIDTILIITAILLSPFFSRGVLDIKFSNLSKKVDDLAYMLRIRITNNDLYGTIMRSKIAEGIKIIKCECLKKAIVFKLEEFSSVIMEIHKTDWSNVDNDFVTELLTKSVDKVNSRLLKMLEECPSCYEEYVNQHTSRTEELFNKIMVTVNDTVNDRDDRLHSIAVLFIADTLSMFNDMQIKFFASCTKRNKAC